MLRRLRVDGFHDLIALVAVMSTRTDIPIQQMIGLPIRKDLRMRSRAIRHSGTIPITMVLVTTWNTSMAKLGVLPIVVMVAKRPTDCPPSIVGAVPIPMRMVGRIQHLTGLQVLVEQAMLGLKTQHNGMIVMVTGVATIPLEQLLTSAHRNPELRLGQVLAVIAGVALIQMVMVGRTLVMHSFTSQRSGETPMATDMVTK